MEFFEIDSTQYDTAQSQVLRSMILRQVKFRAVWYCAESLYTAPSQWPFLKTFVNYEYLGENETEFENILTNWSEAKAGSNDEKN